MNTNEQLIHDFYTAFQARDGKTMSAFYHEEAVFSDPVFGQLHGREVGAMWHMLCARGHELNISFSHIKADEQKGSVHWEAWYIFSNTRRRVHNVIDAQFVFKDGRIIEHHDYFDFWRWASMALGPTGLFLGWTPFVRSRVRKQSRNRLEAFMKNEAAT